MRVLVLGSGAREHAITWCFARSRRISALYVAPGNAGTAELATNLPDLDPLSHTAVVTACREHDITLVFVGPEQPLADGIVDTLLANNIVAIGPSKKSAQLEASKVFSKRFMTSHNLPCAASSEFTDAHAFESFIRDNAGKKLVVKKSGLAAGKGVLESTDPDELISFGTAALTDDSVIVEEFLTGHEISVFALCDGRNHIVLPPCVDFKKAHLGEGAPNTGGMGAICPVPWLDNRTIETVIEKIVEPTFAALEQDGLLYTGVLYFGLMVTDDGPKILEYNVRFGDPEAQVLLPLIRSDFGNLCDALRNGELDRFPLNISESYALGVVVASPGYPGDYVSHLPVSEIPSYPPEKTLVFHASTYERDGVVFTNGGRCFTVVGIAPDLLGARSCAYSAVTSVTFDGSWYRKDIGSRVFRPDNR